MHNHVMLKMYKDEIITEVWQNRDGFSKKHHYNLDEIVADLQNRERTHSDRVIHTLSNQMASSAIDK